jgi:hypothetical protein
MTHDEALRFQLCGGPQPTEAIAHLASCKACQQEIEALERLVTGLTAAAPPPLAGLDGMGNRVVSLLAPPRRSGWAFPSAAALLLTAGLGASWLFQSQTARVPASPASLAALSTPLSIAPLEEDTTAGLLQAYEPLAVAVGQISPEALKTYVSEMESGGWNG